MQKLRMGLAVALMSTAAACASSSNRPLQPRLEVPPPLAEQQARAPECDLGPVPFQPPETNPEPKLSGSNPPTVYDKLQLSDWALTEALKHNSEWKKVDGDNVNRFERCRSPGRESAAPAVLPQVEPKPVS